MIGDAGAPLSDRPVTLCPRNTERTGLAAAESMRAGRVWAILALTGACAPAYAGPPLITDDPEPVEKGDWDRDGISVAARADRAEVHQRHAVRVRRPWLQRAVRPRRAGLVAHGHRRRSAGGGWPDAVRGTALRIRRARSPRRCALAGGI